MVDKNNWEYPEHRKVKKYRFYDNKKQCRRV
jgi:hypothetical protein